MKTSSLRGKAASAALIAQQQHKSRSTIYVSDNDDDDDNADDNTDNDNDHSSTSSSSSVYSDSDNDNIVISIINQAKLYGGLTNWVNITEWRNDRNKHECENLALVIDLLIEEGEVSMNSAALRTLAGRLNGVHLADTTGNWNVCNAISYVGPNNSLLPKSLLTKTLKQAAQFDSLSKKTSRSSSSNYHNYRETNNRNDNNNNTNNNNRSYFSGRRGGRGNYHNNSSSSNSSASTSSSSVSASGSSAGGNRQ